MRSPATQFPCGAPVPDPTPRAAPSHALLQGRAITLDPFDADRDANALFHASHGSAEVESVWTYLPEGPFEDEAELREWYSSAASGRDVLFYTVVDTRSSKRIGIVSFLAIEPAHGTIEIGHIWYARKWQRTLANTEACYLLLGEAFDRLRYRRVEWKCDGLNARSRAAAERLGFQFEGLFRQHRITRGCNRDTAWFSMLDSEWPRIRSGMERWLAWDPAAGTRPSLAQLSFP